MAYFLQLELDSDQIPFQIAVGEAVGFNNEIESSGVDTFTWEASGQINILKKGTYFINWFVAQQTGLALDGGNFTLQIIGDEKMSHSTGSSHLKITSISGFAIVNVDSEPVTIELVNTSELPATLSEDTLIKAKIAIFGVDDLVYEIGDNGNWWQNGEDTGKPAKGATGATGPAGETGAAGNSGEKGATGNTGATGPKGDPGFGCGERGATGATGADGPQGATGPAGAKGETGVQGRDGERGATGATGADGPQGATGPAGSKGDTGEQGRDGERGVTGATGADGLQGATGPAGSKGDTGEQGRDGERGATGATGADGPQGATGPKGDPGSAGGERGPTGLTGASGAQGSTGPTGEAGPAGLNGATGTTGPTGPAGALERIPSIQVCINSNSPTIVNQNAIIPFDTTLLFTTSDISLSNGQITVTKAGFYTLNWEIPIDANDNNVDATTLLAVIIDSSTLIHCFYPLPIGLISGSSLVFLDGVGSGAGNIIYLINDTPGINGELGAIRLPKGAKFSVKMYSS